jgi:predicted nuclease of predicted toxin-antitoxin system
MSLQILIDMNLSVEWISEFDSTGWKAVHWSSIGAPTAADNVIMEWARANRHIVFTHDLDFGALLALTHASGPSVIQVRSQKVLPEDISHLVIGAVKQFISELDSGALVVVDARKSRARVLPIK